MVLNTWSELMSNTYTACLPQKKTKKQDSQHCHTTADMSEAEHHVYWLYKSLTPMSLVNDNKHMLLNAGHHTHHEG